MTKDALRNKIEAIFDCYEELSSFTKTAFNDVIFPYCYDDYVSEHRCLLFAKTQCDNILAIMRQDLLDYDVLTKASYYIEKRLKTIENERE